MDVCKIMEIDPPSHFPTKDDEVKYWMELAYEMYQRSEVTMSELQEYQENSQYLEKELESSFWESDQKNRSLSHDNYKLIAQNTELKLKLNEQMNAYAALEKQMLELKSKNMELVNNVRNLEQKNDDLERDNRALKTMEDDMESRYNDAIEKIALLETDLVEENYVKFDLERLEKENEDLKQRIEIIREESKTDFIRTRKDLNRSATLQNRMSYSMACSSENVFSESPNKLEPKQLDDKLSVNLPMDILMISSPAKRKVPDEDAACPQLLLPSARKQKYNTEGRDLSQIFARFTKQQEAVECNNALNRSIDVVKIKKVKEEEKRQRILSSFIKRLRIARNQLLRRNE